MRVLTQKQNLVKGRDTFRTFSITLLTLIQFPLMTYSLADYQPDLVGEADSAES